MANVNQPFGLNPVLYRNANYWNGANRRYLIPQADASAYYIGDVVKSAANADANGVPAVQAATGTDVLRGVIVGVEQAAPEAASLLGVDLPLSRVNVPASKTRDYYVYVVDDQDIVFEVQGDATGTNQIAANSNKNASLTIAAPSNVLLPFSATVVNSGSIATTAGLNIKLLGLTPRRPSQGFGAFAVWLCMINQHELQGNTAGI